MSNFQKPADKSQREVLGEPAQGSTPGESPRVIEGDFLTGADPWIVSLRKQVDRSVDVILSASDRRAASFPKDPDSEGGGRNS